MCERKSVIDTQIIKVLSLKIQRVKSKELQREREEKEKKQESEVEECRSRRRITWPVFIGWRKSNALRQLRTEFNLFNETMD